MATKLTSDSVEALKLPKAGYTLTWDSDVRGFGVRVTAAGAKSFILDYRTLGGRQRRITLGRHPALTTSQARRRAREELGKVAAGREPRLERQTERASNLRTFGALADLHLEALRARVQPPTERTLRPDAGK